MAADLTTNLELAWLCQDSSGSTVTDSSGNGRDGTYAGTMGSVAGPGGALALGIGLGVGATRSSTFTIDWDMWTVSLWIKGTAHGSAYGDVFSIGGDKLVVRVDDNGGVDGDTLVLLTYDTGYEAETISLGSTLLDDDWHHVLADCDGANCHLYIDDVLIASPAHTRNVVATSAYVAFGSSHASVGFPSGSASGLRVYGNRVLDAASRQAAYDEGTASGLTLDASPATITATPQSAGLNISRTLTASPASITVTPQSAGLTIIGAAVSLDTNRVFNFKLEETSGDVCRNQVRTLVLDDDMSNVTAGVPAGAAADSQFLDGDETTSRSETGGVLTLSLVSGASANVDLFGVRWNGLVTSGKTYVAKLRIRHTAKTGPSTLQVYFGTAALTPATSTEWSDLEFIITANGSDVRILARTDSSSQTTVLEIDRIQIWEENAATPSADMSGLTAPGVSGRGVLMDGTQHILAPYAAGFGSYPFSMGCAFKHDGTAAERTLIAIADADAGSIFWRAKLRSSHELGVNRRNGSTEYLSNLSGALDTNWHTVLAVFPDATSAIAYVDGVEAYNQTGLDSVAAAAAAVDMMIGDFRTTDSVQQWIGNLDEASFWTRALSAAEAAEWHQFTIFPLAARHSAEPLGLETSLSL